MAKMYLQKYETEELQALNSDGFDYILTFLRVSFWGLSKKIVKRKFTVPYHKNLKSFHTHWDNLIKTKKTVK